MNQKDCELCVKNANLGICQNRSLAHLIFFQSRDKTENRVGNTQTIWTLERKIGFQICVEIADLEKRFVCVLFGITTVFTLPIHQERCQADRFFVCLFVTATPLTPANS